VCEGNEGVLWASSALSCLAGQLKSSLQSQKGRDFGLAFFEGRGKTACRKASKHCWDFRSKTAASE